MRFGIVGAMLWVALVSVGLATEPAPVRIAGPSEVPAGELVVLTAEVPEDAGLDWSVTPPEAEARTHIDSDKRRVAFATRAEGMYVFSLAVARDGMAHSVVHVLYNGVGPGPDPEPEPEPEPEPDPEPEPGPRFVLVVMESEARTPGQAAVLMGLREYLQDTEHEWRFVDPDIRDAKGNTPEWLVPYLEEVNGLRCEDGACPLEASEPALLIGVLDEGGVGRTWVEPLPATPAEAIQAVKRRGG